jgi:hypothetical protein
VEKSSAYSWPGTLKKSVEKQGLSKKIDLAEGMKLSSKQNLEG